MSESHPKRNRKRRWLRFSLRTFLIVVVALGVSLGWYVYRVEQQKKAVAWIRENGGWVYYDFEADSAGSPIDADQVPKPNWIQNILGVDFFSNVIVVDLENGDFDDVVKLRSLSRTQFLYLRNSEIKDLTPLTSMKDLRVLLLPVSVTDIEPLAALTRLVELELASLRVSDLTPLSGLTKLEVLWLQETPVEDLTPLATLSNLRELNISHTQVSDVGPLRALTNLEDLQLEQTSVSDLTPLANLKNLEYLGYTKTMVSREEIKKLKRALPNCYFHHD